MLVYRLSQFKYAQDLSGTGAEKFGGRWNSKGYPVVYTCESRALCVTEILVHSGTENIPINFYLSEIEIPDNVPIETLDFNKLLDNWRSFPHNFETQQIGNAFLEQQKSLILKVPSAVVLGDFNYLINPKHPDFKLVSIKSSVAFNFDKRLFAR